jgi:hypothetical protein
MSKCEAELHIGDDFGDNEATMKCQLEEGHAGSHIEQWRSGYPKGLNRAVLWEGDDRDE